MSPRARRRSAAAAAQSSTIWPPTRCPASARTDMASSVLPPISLMGAKGGVWGLPLVVDIADLLVPVPASRAGRRLRSVLGGFLRLAITGHLNTSRHRVNEFLIALRHRAFLR